MHMKFIKPKSKVLLIEPPFYRFFGYQRWYYPVTLTLVATYLEEMGHQACVYDADRPTLDCRSLAREEVRRNYHHYEEALADDNHHIWQEVRRTIEELRPDVVGLSSITPKIDSADIVARIAKEILGDRVVTMLGGPHVQGMLKSHPGCDFGPYFDHIVSAIPNLINRKPNRRLILDQDVYSADFFSTLMTSSGCPNTCTFCCHSFEKAMIYRDLENLRSEVEEIWEKYHATASITTMDDCFFSNQRHFESVTNLFREYGLAFSVGARVMALSPEKIERFIKYGGSRLYIGVESGSQRILDKIEKRLRVEEIVRRTRWLNESGIQWSAFFITGFPFETIDDMKMTVELINTIRPTFVSLNRFTPYPGTKIYDDYFKTSGLVYKDLFQLNERSVVNLSDEMENYIASMYTMFDAYNNNNK
ncbi:MAG: radical SAM protein [Candidatus Riflebacteria bacterium]|nr:radical SAM protein [Candidatus Riflebacteria bacterium]